MDRARSTLWICLLVASTACDVSASEVRPAGNGTPLEAPEFRPWRGTTDAEERPYWRRNLFKRFLSDQAYLVTAWWPVESRRVDFSVPLLVSVALASGSDDGAGTDARWQRAFARRTERGASDLADGLTFLGNAETAVVLAGGTYLISRWSGSERGMRVASLSSEALLNAGLYSALLKMAAARTRPTSTDGGRFFVRSPGVDQEPTSFPSGHAMGAFAVAAVLAGEYRESRWIPWTAYGGATLIALSRVGLGRHYPSDVLAGAVIGRSIGRMVAHRAGAPAETRIWQRFEPTVDPHGAGIGFVYRHSW